MAWENFENNIYEVEKAPKKLSFSEEWFNETYDHYEIQKDDWTENIFWITSKMASENLPNEQKTLFRKIILENTHLLPIIHKWDTIDMEVGHNTVDIKISGKNYNINLNTGQFTEDDKTYSDRLWELSDMIPEPEQWPLD